MKKSIRFIQCLTIINGNVEARRSLRAFRLKLGQVNKQGSFLRPLKRKCRCKRDIHNNIHTTRLCFICFLFVTFTTHIPQLNFYVSLFFFQASIHFHSFYFCSFLSHQIYKTDVSFLYFLYIYFFMLARFFFSFSRVVEFTDSFSFSPTYFFHTLSECS